MSDRATGKCESSSPSLSRSTASSHPTPSATPRTAARRSPGISARAVTVLALSTLLTLGCYRDFGTGGTGELVVPKEELRVIDGLDLKPTTQPTTVVTTLPTSLPAVPVVPEVALNIGDVRRMALANNLDLRVELLNPTIARLNLTEEEARFESLFTANVNYTKTDTPSASLLTGSSVESFSFVPGWQLPLRTGGLVRLEVPFERFETDNEFATLNPAYESDAAFSLSQPLLRGAGTAVTAYPIRVAFYQQQQAEARTKLEVIRVLAVAERVYWRLYAARQERDVRRQQYELAAAQLRRARRQVEVGAQPEVEIVRAEAGVADTLEAIIIAENQLRDRQRELKRVLNQPDLELGSPTAVIPASEPRPIPYDLDPERLSDLAMARRMELLETELAIAQEVATGALARNDLLPLVTFDYTYNVNGLGPSWDESLSMVREDRFADHRFGLRLEVPIGNEAARSRYRASLARRVQLLATREQREVQIRQEVFTAVDQLEANWQRILAARQRVILAARLLEAETRQFEQGLRTTTEVLEAQTNLADARSAEIAALTEYQIAQIDIAQATGTTLGASQIVWEPSTPASSR